MLLLCQPFDPVFFRDARSFAAGENNWANGVFPPPPGVIYGALRSLYFAHNQQKFTLAETDNDPSSQLRITALYWLWQDGQAYFPLPCDCVKKKKSKDDLFQLLTPCFPNNLAWQQTTPTLLCSPEEVEGGKGHLISKKAFQKYLRKGQGEFPALPQEKYLTTEYKVGIGRSYQTGTVQEGLLYQTPLQRWQGLQLAIEYAGLDLPEQGYLKLGGEGKIAHFTTSSKHLNLQGPDKGDLFKLYLATPAFFQAGWYPDFLFTPQFTEKTGLKLELLTAALGKAQIIDGFDMKKKKPKPTMKAVPAGSVYYLRILEGKMQQVIDYFHGQIISEYRKKEGFGLVYVGKVQ